MNIFINQIIRWILEHKAITFLLLVIAFGGIYYCTVRKGLEGEIQREKQARSDEHQERIEQGKTEVNAAANVSNQAMENLNKTANKDSSAYRSDEAENKFCNRYCLDSSCKSWREKNNRECD